MRHNCTQAVTARIPQPCKMAKPTISTQRNTEAGGRRLEQRSVWKPTISLWLSFFTKFDVCYSFKEILSINYLLPAVIYVDNISWTFNLEAFNKCTKYMCNFFTCSIDSIFQMQYYMFILKSYCFCPQKNSLVFTTYYFTTLNFKISIVKVSL